MSKNIPFHKSQVIIPQHSIGSDCVTEIKCLLRKYKQIVIDMKNVSEFSNSALSFLNDYGKYITLVNTDSRILFLMYASGIDKNLKIFEDETSLSENKNKLVLRRLFIV